MIFTERPGRVRVFQNGKLQSQPLFVVPDVEPGGESGLMSVALHPQFASNRLLYLSYAYNSDGEQVRVVRYRETPNGLTDRKVIIENIPAAQFHAGCRLRFGPDGKLYITTGDATDRNLAQQLNSIAGKILRLNDDGTIPSDNPFVGRSDARPEILAYGSRNAQGIDFQPGTNLLFETEHGPSGFDGPGGGDEVNIIDRGKNYGWPAIHHRQTQRRDGSAFARVHAGMRARQRHVLSRLTASAVQREIFSSAACAATRIIRVVLDGRRVVSEENLLEGKYGRIRDIAEGPDGFIYFSTSNRDGRGKPASDDDRIMRLVPVK